MGALGAVVRVLIGVPVHPPLALVDRFPELGAVRYRRGGLPPRLGGWALGTRSVAAITLWRTVFLASGTAFSAELLLHELAHVRQFEGDGAFPFRYLWKSVRVGYHRNPYEIAARKFAEARLRNGSVRSSHPQDT